MPSRRMVLDRLSALPVSEQLSAVLLDFLVSVLKLVESLESFVIQERRPDSRKDPDVDA
jgi:hypothetical protein